MPPKVVITDPTPLKASEGAKSAAKLRSKSKEAAQLPKPDLGDAWAPTSWQSKPITQDVVYDDYTGVEAALEKLESLPPLVSPFEIEKLRTKLADAANGKAFVLQGGDCAELFDYCTQDRIEAKLKVLMQMSLVLLWGTGLPVVRIGRIAGQYAKPRSKLTEEVDGKTINSFRGDNINGFDVSDRKPDPARLVSSYFHSAATLNYIRCVLASGFADLRKVDWSLEHVQNAETKERYQKTLDAITEGLQFMHTIGADTSQDMQTIDFFTSHEALLLEYEQSLTREANGHHYNTSAHFIWIGDRTRQLDGAHVEFFRGVRNPIGIKVGPTMQADELVRLLDIVDANHEDGRVTLITRYGASKVKELLPAHIKAVQSSGHKVVWMSDPCHGNTQTSAVTKLKTRHVDDIVEELRQALQIHRECGSKLNGAHLELTGDAVTECIGGSAGLCDEDLVVRYDTVCDPRLSLSQSLDVSFLIADSMRAQK